MMLLTDVTLRDGLQSESKVITTENKIELFQKLLPCSFHRIEVTSFVHPKWVPQMADADVVSEKVFALTSKRNDSKKPELMAFVPNEKGLERLLKFPYPWVSCFIAVSESFNKKNVGATRGESLIEVGKIIEKGQAGRRKVRVYISTAFGCPYEGKIPTASLLSVFKSVSALKPDEIALGDTIGVATPAQVDGILSASKAFWPIEKTALHFHNTYGMALAAAQAGYNQGIRLFDGAVGGTGGCPYAKGATGNVALEELAYLGWRQANLSTFKPEAFIDVIEYLKKIDLTPSSNMASILSKGGNWLVAV